MLWQTLQTGSTWLERDAAFSALFTSPLSFISDNLASFYGFETSNNAPNAQGLRETLLPDTYPAGLLHGWLLATAHKRAHLRRFTGVSWFANVSSAKNSRHHHRTRTLLTGG